MRRGKWKQDDTHPSDGKNKLRGAEKCDRPDKDDSANSNRSAKAYIFNTPSHLQLSSCLLTLWAFIFYYSIRIKAI